MLGLVLAALLLAGCEASTSKSSMPPEQMATGEAFSIQIPEDAILAHEPSGLDFEIYRVVVAGVNAVGVYVGNAPNTQDWAQGSDPNPSQRTRDDGVIERVWRTSCRGWPSHIHVWAVPGYADRAAANRMVESLVLKACPASP